MKFQTFYQNAFYLLVGCIIGFAIATSMYYKPVKTEVQLQTQPIEKVVTFDSVKHTTLNDANLMKELIRQGVQHPEIVLAQAQLETGFYRSDVCKKYNNLFGLRHKNGYYKFNNWQESVTAYRDYVQYRYKGGDYFAFLEKIGYAEESKYTQYVKSLI